MAWTPTYPKVNFKKRIETFEYNIENVRVLQGTRGIINAIARLEEFENELLLTANEVHKILEREKDYLKNGRIRRAK
jgi:hypothetical protein